MSWKRNIKEAGTIEPYELRNDTFKRIKYYYPAHYYSYGAALCDGRSAKYFDEEILEGFPLSKVCPECLEKAGPKQKGYFKPSKKV